MSLDIGVVEFDSHETIKFQIQRFFLVTFGQHQSTYYHIDSLHCGRTQSIYITLQIADNQQLQAIHMDIVHKFDISWII